MLGIAKTFGVTEKYALYEISYQNAIMYSRVVPMPHDEDETARLPFDESKDACNPENFKGDTFTDEQVIRV